MKPLLLSFALILPGCVSARDAGHAPPDMVVAYRDLALDTHAGRARLARRVDRAVLFFCATYDPQDENAIFDVRLASTKLCPSAAALMLASKMPGQVRRAYQAGVRGE